MEHRPSTTCFHRTRFWAIFSSPLKLYPFAAISASIPLLQVCFGLPRLRFPDGFHRSACFVMLSMGFLSVCPIHDHFLLLITLFTGSWPVLSPKFFVPDLFWPGILSILRRNLLSFIYCTSKLPHIRLTLYMAICINIIRSTSHVYCEDVRHTFNNGNRYHPKIKIP